MSQTSTHPSEGEGEAPASAACHGKGSRFVAGVARPHRLQCRQWLRLAPNRMRGFFAAFAAAALCATSLAPAGAFLPGSAGFAGSNAKVQLRAARSSATNVPNFLRLPKLRTTSAGVASALQMAISDESMISTSGGAGGFFT